MKSKKSFRKIWILVVVCFVFVCGTISVFFAKYNSDFFNNILLSLTISSSVDPDDGEIENVGGGGGTVIFKVPVKKEEVEEESEFEVPLDPEDGEVKTSEPDQVVSEFMDEVNGISVAKQSDKSRVDLIVTVPFLDAFSINDVLIPTSPSKDIDIIYATSYLSFSGVTTPYTYILLEVSSQPNIVTLFTGSDGKWSYKLPYALSEGLHHAYVWGFSQTDGVRSLISSKAFMVSGISGDSEVSGKVTEIFMQDGLLTGAVSTSSLAASLKNGNVGKQMLYINGRVLNDGESFANTEKLAFIVFVKPLFGEFTNVDSVDLEFSYKIYNEKGELIEQVLDGDDDGYVRHFENGVLSFTKYFSFTSSDRIGFGSYNLIVEVNANGFNYWLPLSFEVVKEVAGGDSDGYLVILFLSLALIVLIAGSLYAGQFSPRSSHRRGR